MVKNLSRMFFFVLVINISVTVSYGEPVDDLWRDGITDKQDMTFRVDVPDGIYNVWATVGDEEWSRLDLNIAAEDTFVHEDIRTWIF